MPQLTGGNNVGSSSQIADGVILNADINASAAIARSKLDFGSGLVNTDIAAAAGIALSKLATDPLARANHTGSQLSSTISDFNSAVAALASASFPAQDLGLNNSGVAPDGVASFVMFGTADITGTVMFYSYMSSSTVQVILRIVKDTVTGNFYITHSTTLTVSSQSNDGLVVVGNYLYVFASIAGTGSCRRYDKADLANVTSMTIAGSNIINSQNGPVFTDNVDIYYYSGTNTFTKHTISGTTLTNSGTTNAYTSVTAPKACICDGTSVYISQDDGSGAYNIWKYPLAGGAITSTTTPRLQVNAWYNGQRPQFFFNGTTMLGISWLFNSTSATAIIGLQLHLMAITKP